MWYTTRWISLNTKRKDFPFELFRDIGSQEVNDFEPVEILIRSSCAIGNVLDLDIQSDSMPNVGDLKFVLAPNPSDKRQKRRNNRKLSLPNKFSQLGLTGQMKSAGDHGVRSDSN